MGQNQVVRLFASLPARQSHILVSELKFGRTSFLLCLHILLLVKVGTLIDHRFSVKELNTLRQHRSCKRRESCMSSRVTVSSRSGFIMNNIHLIKITGLVSEKLAFKRTMCTVTKYVVASATKQRFPLYCFQNTPVRFSLHR